MNEAKAIDAFWAYWGDERAAIEAAIEGGALREFVEPISARVRAISPGLDWEFGKGREAAHYFCVSAKGDAVVRVVAERWRAAGPDDDAVFEFHAARPGGGYAGRERMVFDGVEVQLDDFRFLATPNTSRERVDIVASHPAFAGRDESFRGLVTFVVLDSALGEDEVERWIGAVELTDQSLEADGDGGSEVVGLAGLVECVDAMRASATGDMWAILRGAYPDGAPVVIMANLAVKRLDHLALDHHVAVTVPLLSPREDGLCADEEVDELNALEDALIEAAGPGALHLGRETGRGERVMHFHAAGPGAVVARLRAACAAWAGSAGSVDRGFAIEAEHDPAWSVLRRW